MAKIYQVKLTTGPNTLYSVYYDSVIAANVAMRYPEGVPALNIPYASVSATNGIEVSVPDATTSVILYSPACALEDDYVVDTTAPTTPVLSSSFNTSNLNITLTWTASTDAGSGVAGYKLYKQTNSGAYFLTFNTSTLTYLDTTTKTPTDTISYKVLAYDVEGNETAFSNIEAVYIAQADSQAPTVPWALSYSAQQIGSATLTFIGSTDNIGVTGYQVYREGSLFATNNSSTLSNTITPTTSGGQNNFKVRAYDAAGNYSAFSTIKMVYFKPPSITLSAGTITDLTIGLNMSSLPTNDGINQLEIGIFPNQGSQFYETYTSSDTDTAHTITVAQADKQYSIRVRYNCTASPSVQGEWSNTISVVTDPTPTTTP